MVHLIRLKDIGNVELGAENYDSSVNFNGKKVFLLAFKQHRQPIH